MTSTGKRRFYSRGWTGRRDYYQAGGYGMAKKRMIYEGKAKILYEGPEPGTIIQ